MLLIPQQTSAHGCVNIVDKESKVWRGPRDTEAARVIVCSSLCMYKNSVFQFSHMSKLQESPSSRLCCVFGQNYHEYWNPNFLYDPSKVGEFGPKNQPFLSFLLA